MPIEPWIVIELDDLDRELITKCRKGIEYLDNGDPIKDVMDQDEMEDAIRLLVAIVDGREM